MPLFVTSQKVTTSIFLGYQVPYFKFHSVDYASYAQTPFQSYTTNISVNHTFKANLGLEFQLSYRADKFKERYNYYLSPVPYDVKETEYKLEYLVVSQGINYVFKLNEKFNFIVQTSLKACIPIKRQMTRTRYNGIIDKPSNLPYDDQNGLLISPEIKSALSYQISQKIAMKISFMYGYNIYNKDYAIDAAVRSASSIELSIGYSF